MKKLFCIILSALLLLSFSLCSCGGEEQSKPTDVSEKTSESEKSEPADVSNEESKKEESKEESKEVSEAHKHSYTEEITKEPTCTAKGEKTFKCECGDTYTEEIEAAGHKYKETVTKEATCVDAGEKELECSICGDKKTETIKATGKHKYTEEITKQADCKNNGEKVLTCSVCNDSKTEIIKATGKHNYTEKITKQVTCTENGEKVLTCTGCGDTKTETIKAKGHDWKKATCTEPKTCKNCGATEGTAPGHKFSNGKCTVCGAKAEAIFILPTLPASYNYSSSSGKLYQTCRIDKLEIEYYTSSYSSGLLWYNFYFVGEATYNYQGTNQSSSQKVSYKIYDPDGIVVKSGTMYSESVAPGEKFREKVTTSAIFEAGKTYTIKLLNTN